MNRPLTRLVVASVLVAATTPSLSSAATSPRFEITVSSKLRRAPLTGRLVLVLAKSNQNEPRLTISPRGPAMFGMDLDQLRPDQPIVLDETSSLGFPMSLADIPPGDYFAQAVINVYEQVHRSDGKTIWVHMNDGRVEFFSNAAGNLYSASVPVHIGGDGVIKLTVDKVIAADPGPTDTEWLKHVKIQSPMLTRFWGRPVFVHAHVLLP